MRNKSRLLATRPLPKVSKANHEASESISQSSTNRENKDTTADSTNVNCEMIELD